VPNPVSMIGLFPALPTAGGRLPDQSSAPEFIALFGSLSVTEAVPGAAQPVTPGAVPPGIGIGICEVLDDTPLLEAPSPAPFSPAGTRPVIAKGDPAPGDQQIVRCGMVLPPIGKIAGPIAPVPAGETPEPSEIPSPPRLALSRPLLAVAGKSLPHKPLEADETPQPGSEPSRGSDWSTVAQLIAWAAAPPAERPALAGEGSAPVSNRPAPVAALASAATGPAAAPLHPAQLPPAQAVAAPADAVAPLPALPVIDATGPIPQDRGDPGALPAIEPAAASPSAQAGVPARAIAPGPIPLPTPVVTTARDGSTVPETSFAPPADRPVLSPGTTAQVVDPRLDRTALRQAGDQAVRSPPSTSVPGEIAVAARSLDRLVDEDDRRVPRTLQPAGEAPPTTPLTAAPPVTPAADRSLSAAAGPAVLDTARDDWMSAMIEHVTEMREAGGARALHIKLLPDALGAVEVRVRQEDSRVGVEVVAQNPAAQQLLAEAAPRLHQMAEERGLRLGQGSIGGGMSGGDPGGSRQGEDRRAPNANASATTAEVNESRLVRRRAERIA
jgi:flagellar hook-length control protein FliK